MAQIICHFNIHNDLPDSDDNGRIFGIFLDNIVASNQYIKLCDWYESTYIDFRTYPLIQHDKKNDKCPDFSGSIVISPANRKRLDPFSFVNKSYIPGYDRIMKLRGTKLYVIKNTLEAQHNGWDAEYSSYVGGIFTHRCCAEKYLVEIIQKGLYYHINDFKYFDDPSECEIKQEELSSYLPIIKEYTEGVIDTKYEKNRKAYKDLSIILNDMIKDPNHPGRKWLEEDYGNDNSIDWEKISLFDYRFAPNNFSEALREYLEWMKNKMNMDLHVETLGYKTKEMQLYYAYNEIFKLKNQVDKCHIICKMINHCTN